MEDRETVIVYLPGKVKKRFQEIADWEGTSISAAIRRVLIAEFNSMQRKDRSRRSRRR